MSVDALSWAFRLRLTPVQKLTLLSLADRADGSGRSWSSCRDTMARTGLSERCVQTAIKEMAALGYVEIQQRFAPDGRQRSNMYRVQYVEKWNDAAPPQHADEADDQAESTPPDGQNMDEGGMHHMRGGDAPPARMVVVGGTECGGVGAQPASPYLNRQERTVTKQESSLRSESSVSEKRAASKVKGWKDDPAFTAFYAVYPRHDAPADAWKSWQRATKEATAAEIMGGLRRYRFDERPQFIPMPSTWLNQQRWMAEPTVVPPPPPSRGWGNTTSGGF